MRISKIFLASLLFFGLFAGGQTVMGDLWSSHDVQSNTSLTIRDDYQQIQNDLSSENNSIRSKIERLDVRQSGVLDAASAGILLVPQLIGVLISPITSLLGALTSVTSTFTVFLPGWAATLVELIIISTVVFAILWLLLGVRT